MGTGYTRNDASNNIADGNIINASDLDGEFNAIVSALSTTGHSHDGTAAEGGPILKLGPNQQLTIASTSVTPSSDGVFDIGASGSQFKDLYIDGVAYVDAINFNGTAIAATAVELNIVDGDTAASTGVTIATSDKFIINDGGTMKQLTFADLETWVETNIDAGANLTTVGALAAGSITSGFGSIDNGASNITSGGVLKLDVDADADDLTGDSAVGRLTLGAGEDLNLYHGGTNSYIVNDTGNLIIDTVGDIVLDADGADVVLKDAGTQYAALTNDSGNLVVKSGTTTALTMSGADVTIAGDLTISGDDLTMGTNTAGMLLVADGTNFNPTAVTALSEIATVANDDVFLAIDTSGGGLKKIARSVVVAGLATSSAISNIVDDGSPQLGADLDTNSFNIAFDDAHGINDDSGNEFVVFQKTATAVNQLDITNAATNGSPEISATGDDSNISLKLTPKGTGQVLIDGNIGIESGLIDLKNAGSVSALRLYCEASNAHYAALVAPAHSDFSGNVTLTLPSTTSTVVGDTAAQTLTNKTLTSPVLNVGVSGTAVLDEDDLSTNSNTQLATQQSIKAYVDSQAANMQFVLEDGDGTELQITKDKELKFVEGGGIDINWTDTSDGTDGDPYDLTFTINAAQTDITSLLATDIKIGEDNETKIDFETADTINFYAGNEKQLILTDGALTPGANAIIDLGTDALEFKDAYFDGTVEADAITIAGANVTTIFSPIAGGSGIVTTGALNSGSITSGFSSIDIGDGALTATGAVTLGATTFGDNNITNVGNIALDSLTADGSTITITGNTTFADGAYDFDIASHDGSTGLKLGGVLVSVTAAEINAVTSKASTGKAIAMAMVFG
tara:strand:+ start:6760 stop:9315 length:2556 start_codon:yes stop_codon:yes gene_type:complete